MKIFDLAPRMATILVAALLAACGGGDAPPPAAQQQGTVIGAAGGTINGPGGVTLTIPPDALASDTLLTLTLDGSGAPPLPAGIANGPLIALLPHGTIFNVPVQITVPFDAALLQAGQPPLLLKTNEQRDGWQQPSALTAGSTLTAWITSFSYTLVGYLLPPQFGDQPRDCAVVEGGWCFFRAAAVGAHSFTYRWLRNGIPLNSETNNNILIDPVSMSDDGALYSLEATGRLASGHLLGPVISNTARLTVIPSPPKIVNDPADQQVVEGNPATFSAASTSSVVQTLQWKRCGAGANCGATTANWDSTTNVGGASAPSYTLASAQFADDGARFALCARNSAGTACSREARLSVLVQPVQPVITAQPQSISVTAGFSASFSVQATGGGLTYEWSDSRDGVSFAPRQTCGNSATCTISNTVQGDSGTYFSVRVFNTVGAAVSAPPALLTVRRAPTLALTRVAGGAAHSVGLQGNGTLVAWGANDQGQLGRGTAGLLPAGAAPVTGLSGVVTYSVGAMHNFALLANGEIWAWGSNSFGELGLIPDAGLDRQPSPSRALGGAPARHIAASTTVDSSTEWMRTHSLAAFANNPVVSSWGSNVFGQLGDGLAEQTRAPDLVPNLTLVTRVAAGGGFSLARRENGSVWAWGRNSELQLGVAGGSARLTPGQVPGVGRVIDVAAGSTHSLALDEDGTVWAWGSNVRAQIGNLAASTVAVAEPTRIVLPAPAISIAAGCYHSIALLEDGRVYTWGNNLSGQIGIDQPLRMPFPHNVLAPLPAGIIAIGAGCDHSLAVDGNFDVWAWGANDAGQLGDGTTQGRSTPARVLNVNLR